MKKILSFILLGLMCSIGNLWAYESALGDVALSKVSNGGNAKKLADGCYAYRGASGYSWTNDKGIKTQSNTGGIIVFYISTSTNITVDIMHTESKNAHDVTASIYSLSSSAYDAFYGITNETAVTFTLPQAATSSFTISIPAETNTFSKTQQIASGYYAIVCSGVKSNTYFNAIHFEMAEAPVITTDLSSTDAVSVGIAKDFSIIASGASSYQWYSNTTNTTAGATAIVGATSASYSYTAQAEGTVYLYCVATNAIGSTNSAICAVTATNPPAVTTASISGVTSAYKGVETTYTATAENATTFAWYVDGSVQNGQTSATFVYTPNAVGNHTIYCTATNDYTATPIQSNTINVSVYTLYGELIKATLNGGNSANMSGVIGGTFDSNLGSGKYKIDKNTYAGVQLASGYSFQEGDTVIITMTTAGSNYPCLFEDKNRSNCLYLATEGSSDLEYKIVLPAAANGLTTLYLSRGDDTDNYKWNPVLSAISVVRPMSEKSRSAATINSVEVNDEALDAASLNTLKSTHSFASVSQFANAPVVKFYTSVTVTYEDDSQKVLNDSVVVTAVENGDLWQAQAEIDAVTYTITAVHPVSFTVTYMYGETILGEEAVIAGESPANYATHQSLQLATFNGWFSDAGLSNAVTMTNAEIVQDTTFYASFTLLFAESINIEQLVLDNGTGYDLMAQMGAQYYASNLTNNLDSLNDEKSKRNEPYLGQKAKIAGSLLNFRVAADNTVKVKFGNIGKTPQVSINGGDYANMTITNGVYTYVADADALLSIKTADASTVVFKQIVIGADPQIATVVLPATSAEITLGANGWSTYAATYDFTVSGATVYKAAYDAVKNAVVLTEVENAVVPAEEGIILKGTEGDEITINSTTNAVSDFAGNKLVGTISEKTAPANAYVISTNAGVTMFNPIDPDADPAIKIPAHKAYMIIAPAQGAPSAIRIEFAENNATDIKSIMDSEKAVKFIENGKLFILKNGVVYDVTGAMVK